MKKYPCILQYDEEDCGSACIASIAKYFGRDFTISHVRALTGTGHFGTNLLGLKRGAELLGFNTASLKVSVADIKNKQNILPAIIHWKGNHFVVLFGKQKKKYVIADPGIGLRYLTLEELASGWQTNIVLSLTPNVFIFYNQPNDKVSGLNRFSKQIFRFRKLIIEVILINMVIGLLGLASPILIQLLTDDILIRGDSQMLAQISIAVLLMGFISSCGQLIQSFLISWISQKFELNLMLEFGKKILNFPLSYYEQRRSGEITSRLEDISSINQLVSQIIIGLPSQLFIAIISILLMYFYSFKLAIVSIVIAFLMTLSTFVLYPILEKKIRDLMILDSENQGILVESFRGALHLKTTVAESDIFDELQTRFNRLSNLTLDTFKISIVNDFFSDIVAFAGQIYILWYGSSLVISREMSIGQLLAFYTMNQYLTSFINLVIELVDDFTKAKTATKRLSEIIDTTTEIENDKGKSWLKLDSASNIYCQNISFQYSGKKKLIDNLSLEIPGGKITAITGKSGCGKSTLAKIISGLYPLNTNINYQYNSGYIRIDSFNIQDVSLHCLRKQIVLVPQNTNFWSRSILENFRIGNPSLKDEDIFDACHLTGVDQFVCNLPNSYLTVLGEFGANLSGGQRQRMAIALALVKNPAILILDESTSALDYESEDEILNNIFAYRKGKTTIVVSHRIEVFSKADCIIKLDNGRLESKESSSSLII